MKKTNSLTPREMELKIKEVGGPYWKLYYTQGATPAILRAKPETKKNSGHAKLKKFCK